MLYDLNFLKTGEVFPPREELERLDAYRVNDLLLNDEPWTALPEHKRRVLFLLSNFSLTEPKDCYLYNANYWAELADKTRELTFGARPTIKTDRQDVLNELLENTRLYEKGEEGVGDLCAFGDWIVKIKEGEAGNGTFINVDPSIWFPVVSFEDVKTIKYHVLAWVVNNPIARDKFELHVQIHEKGNYKNRAFDISDSRRDDTYTVPQTKQVIRANAYKIGAELKTTCDGFTVGDFETGLDDFAIVQIPNDTTSKSIYGKSDFDKITDAAIAYNTRMTLKDVVLDKHSAPLMYGPPLTEDERIGNYLEVPPDDPKTPGYLVWDAAMTAVDNTIAALKEDTANLSGMGSILDTKTFGESQGYDALMIKLAPALMRAAKKTSRIEPRLKKIISLVSQIGYGKIEERDLEIAWHSGIPTTESVRADIAAKHLATGWSRKRVLMLDYGLSEEEAEAEIAQKEAEAPPIPQSGYGAAEDGESDDE